jgi:hypothetical protein
MQRQRQISAGLGGFCKTAGRTRGSVPESPALSFDPAIQLRDVGKEKALQKFTAIQLERFRQPSFAQLVAEPRGIAGNPIRVQTQHFVPTTQHDAFAE